MVCPRAEWVLESCGGLDGSAGVVPRVCVTVLISGSKSAARVLICATMMAGSWSNPGACLGIEDGPSSFSQ